ncbi:hypothetical protein L1987_15115 [Smallanthus sonchifolius]|uniref:Uncharacterized protein n=1 Tax=Smallanthus sonchifolius TaxID=185202 RepID=A0ACB9J6Y7_9ASTR|nr:hypothetical protein L1987_15115 [Smallanthus sonchifolius]
MAKVGAEEVVGHGGSGGNRNGRLRAVTQRRTATAVMEKGPTAGAGIGGVPQRQLVVTDKGDGDDGNQRVHEGEDRVGFG